MAFHSRKVARDSRSARLPSGAKPKPQRSSQSQPIVEQPELEQATAELATVELQSSRPDVLLTRWVLCPALAVIAITGGIGIYLYRGIQTYRYYDWTILPISDTRLEAACGELTVYYMSWQDPKAEKPIGHVSQCQVVQMGLICQVGAATEPKMGSEASDRLGEAAAISCGMAMRSTLSLGASAACWGVPPPRGRGETIPSKQPGGGNGIPTSQSF